MKDPKYVQHAVPKRLGLIFGCVRVCEEGGRRHPARGGALEAQFRNFEISILNAQKNDILFILFYIYYIINLLII